MRRFRGPNAAPAIENTGEDWLNTIVTRMRSGNVVPIISNSLINQLVFGNNKELWEDWRDFINLNKPEMQRVKFPDDVRDPAGLTQFWSIYTQFEALEDHRRVKEKYLEFLLAAAYADASTARLAELKETTDWQKLPFTEAAYRLGLAPLERPRQNALRILASLRFPVYVTTSYHSFLEMAIEDEIGKKPRQEVSKWYAYRGQSTENSRQDSLFPPFLTTHSTNQRPRIRSSSISSDLTQFPPRSF